MITYYKDYGVTASIKDMRNGNAVLTAKVGNKTIKRKVYSSRNNALRAWKRMCD